MFWIKRMPSVFQTRSISVVRRNAGRITTARIISQEELGTSGRTGNGIFQSRRKIARCHPVQLHAAWKGDTREGRTIIQISSLKTEVVWFQVQMKLTSSSLVVGSSQGNLLRSFALLCQFLASSVEQIGGTRLTALKGHELSNIHQWWFTVEKVGAVHNLYHVTVLSFSFPLKEMKE